MVPTDHANLHVHSTAVVLDGEPREAIVGLTVDARGVHRATSIIPTEDVDVVGVTALGDAIVAPAPLDLHFHGAGGHVVPPGGATADIDHTLRVEAARHAHIAAGVPAYEWVATLPIPGIDRGRDVLAHVADEVARAARAITAARTGDGTGCVGLRIEGLFINPARAGVWPPEAFLPPLAEHLDVVARAASDAGTPLVIVDMAAETVAPEQAVSCIERARELGIVVSLAHTDATWEQAIAAIDAGATLATHTWNAMRPLTHREPGVVAAVLTDERVTCELICDGVHVHPGTIALTVAATGRDGWVAVSDASPFAGCAPGDYEWAGTTVHHDGTALRDHAGRLAGSASLLWRTLDVLADARLSRFDAVVAMGAAPRRVLDPGRSLGLQVGDPVWVV